MLQNLISLFFCAAIILLSLPSYAITPMFRHYGIKEGLSQSTSFAIIQDRTGFIWIGTKSGLNRFDGTALKVYYAKNGKNSIGSNFINSLAEDDKGNIWIGTDAGVWIYNPLTDSFKHFGVHCADGTKVSGNANLIKVYRHFIYIAVNEKGLFKYDINTKKLYHHLLIGHPNVSSLELMQNGTLAIGFYGGGLYFSDTKLHNLQPFRTVDGQEPLKDDVVTSILQFSPRKVFVGSEKNGLSIVNPIKNCFYNVVNKFNGKNIFVRALARQGNDVWAASEMGLYHCDASTLDITHYMNSPNDPYSLSDNPLYSLFTDKEGGLWAGSYFGGVNYLPPYQNFFDRILPAWSDGKQILGRRVREMVQDYQGRIWIGTEDAGLSCYNPANGKITHIDASLAFPNVHGLCVDGPLLWVGAFSYGLKVIDIRTGQVVKSYNLSAKSGGLRSASVFSICKSTDGYMYFGTINGLCRMKMGTDFFEYVNDIPPLLIYDVNSDSHGNLWAATLANGIYVRMKGDGKWININVGSGKGLTSNQVLGIYEDGNGNVWFPTQGGGVCKYNFTTKRLERLNIYSGMDNTVFQVVEDRDGLLWFTTYDGLISYNPAKKSVRLYSNSSLMLDNEFNYSSSLLSNDGQIYLGSLSGLIKFKPRKLDHYHIPSRLTASQLWIGNEQINNLQETIRADAGSIVFAKSISLSSYQNSFSIRVVPLQYAVSSSEPVEYKLEGFDKSWQDMHSGFIIAYSHLPAGHYTLKVRLKEGGKLSSQGYTLDVTVRSHPLWSIWAKLFYAIAICLIIWRTIWVANVRMKHRRLRAQEKFEHQKEQKLYESKIKFFTNVAHEIRTPLTLIKGPLDNIIKSNTVQDPEIQEDLKVMQKNTDSLARLINQLLDFRKTEQERLKLNFEKCDIGALVKGVYDRFALAIHDRHIDASLSIKSSKLYVYVDKEGFSKMISNLMSNAVKYCASRIIVIVSNDGNNFSVEVRNDGNIIPKNMRTEIFKMFSRLENAENTTGTGIGLALTKAIAELHGGQIRMVDDETMNIFLLTLPIHQDEAIDVGKTASDKEEYNEKGFDKMKKTILIVEDNAEMRDYESRRLRHTYNILTASDGESALNILSQHSVDIIVSDIMMEPMDGLELLRRVKHDDHYSFIPVILLTAVTADSAKLDSMENGADLYIVKPFSMDFLADKIANLLRQREEVKRVYTGSPFVSSETVSISTADTLFLSKLKKAVMKNLSNTEFNVDKLAEEIGMSRSSLNRKMKGTLGISANNYIRLERLKEAAKRLSDGESKISEVCGDVGFSSPSYFAKSFYQQFGILPKEFSKRDDA